MALISTLLALRRDARILKIPPYLSALLVVVGVAWLLVLPLNEHSRHTYVSENALLPGQVHTYFTGSEHNVFRAYRHEVANLEHWSDEDRSNQIANLFTDANLKVAKQKYTYHASGRNITNHNVYAILQGPRADATEAIVLMAAWRNMDDAINYSGVALVLSLARYFKRWSLWSKDIIFLISGDSTTGPQAWVDAYHNAHDPRTIESLSIKSGALQGAVGIDYPAGPWGHRYDKLHIVYDGTNGQLPNLDLFNTAVNIASGQMGISCTLQRMFSHADSYKDRLLTIFRGMVSQGLGHATGPHSAFIPYHVDAITLVTVGDGWHDEMSLGRTVESIFRSLNNLLEHLHQSFFFYLLLEAKRFVSIGTYLPSAMLIAASFSIMAIAKWVESGRPVKSPNPASTKPPVETAEKVGKMATEVDEKESTPTPMTVAIKDSATVVLPTSTLTTLERPLLPPIALLLFTHFIGLIPLYVFNTLPIPYLAPAFLLLANLSTLAPLATAFVLAQFRPLTHQETTLLQSFSLLFLGMILSTLATLNFSLSFFIGLFCAPLSFVRTSKNRFVTGAMYLVLAALNPVLVVHVATKVAGLDLGAILAKAAEGWHVWGLWTQVVFWLVWWPAWFVGSLVVGLGIFQTS